MCSHLVYTDTFVCDLSQNLSERGSNPDEGGIPGVQTAQSQTASAGSPPQQTGRRQNRVRQKLLKTPPILKLQCTATTYIYNLTC